MEEPPGACGFCYNYADRIEPVLLYNRTVFRQEDTHYRQLGDPCFYCGRPVAVSAPPYPRDDEDGVPYDWRGAYLNDTSEVYHLGRSTYFQSNGVYSLIPTRSVPPVRSALYHGTNLELQYADMVACQTSIATQSPLVQLSAQDLIDNARVCSPDYFTHTDAVSYFRDIGVCDEYLYPYQGGWRNTRPIARQGVRVKVHNFHSVQTPTFKSVCRHIKTTGPLLAPIELTDNFNIDCTSSFTAPSGASYSLYEGLYSSNPTNMNDAVLHSLLVVGYDRNHRALIVKNTYGIAWGYLGFLKIHFDTFKSFFIYPSGIGISPM